MVTEAATHELVEVSARICISLQDGNVSNAGGPFCNIRRQIPKEIVGSSNARWSVARLVLLVCEKMQSEESSNGNVAEDKQHKQGGHDLFWVPAECFFDFGDAVGDYVANSFDTVLCSYCGSLDGSTSSFGSLTDL